MWDSKLFKAGTGILLFFLIIFVGSRIAFIFRPFIIAFEALFFSFLISGILYYITVPFVDWLHDRKFPRPAAIALVYLFIAGLLTLGIVLTGPVLQHEVTVLVNSIPEKVQEFRQLIETIGESPLVARLLELESFNPDEITNRISGSISRAFTQLTTSLAALIDFTTGLFMTIIIIPFLLYYMLKEKGSGSIPALVKNHAPRKYAENINRGLAEMNRLLASYVQGLGLVCLFVGILAYIGFLIIGLEYALILALFIMITNVVPFLGPFIGAIPALILGLLESPWVMLQVLIVIIAVQQIESLLISPQVMGRKLSLSPLAIILIVLVAGRLGGLLGIILAIPIFTMLKIVAAHIYEHLEENRRSGQEKPAE
jgi:predicted PurR-regulated permease PerM